MLSSTTPSEWARQLVSGAYDLHVHVAPDVMRRRVTDLQLARRCQDVGLAGFVLKSHYVSTAERAAVLNEVLAEGARAHRRRADGAPEDGARADGARADGVRVIGALTLNASVGGMNPLAVEIAAREGARILWMPTLDALNHRVTHGDLPAGATPPMWLALQADLDAQGITVDPVPVLDAAGRPLPATREVLSLAARHQLVVATGHLSAFETRVVADAAFEAGVRHVIATHPEFPQQNLSRADQLALVRQGAFLERCFTTPFTGKYEWARMGRQHQGHRRGAHHRHDRPRPAGQPSGRGRAAADGGRAAGRRIHR